MKSLLKLNSSGPKIAVTGPTRGGAPAWMFTQLQIRWQGGRPIRLTPDSDWQNTSFDGLVLGGGADIEPTLYNQETRNNSHPPQGSSPFKRGLAKSIQWFRNQMGIPSSRGLIDPQRDRMELSLLRDAVESHKPVLGICRGMQMINVFFGGSLQTDLHQFYGETPLSRSTFPSKFVQLTPGSRIAQIAGKTRLSVNSLHDQAVKDLGRSLVSTAIEDNKIIQAIETDSSTTSILGIQWHPEYLVAHQPHRKIFHWLIDESKKTKSSLTGSKESPFEAR